MESGEGPLDLLTGELAPPGFLAYARSQPAIVLHFIFMKFICSSMDMSL